MAGKDDRQTEDVSAQAVDEGTPADDTAAEGTDVSANVTLERSELERLRHNLWRRYHSGLSR